MIFLVTVGVCFGVFYNKKQLLKENIKLLIIPLFLLLPRIIAFFIGDINLATSEFIRSLPLILFPIAFIISNTENIIQLEKSIYFGILFGILLFMIICNIVVINEMIKGNEPLEYFFRWRHLNVNFVRPIETHPPYLGVITVWLFVKTIYKPYLNKFLRYNLIVILSLFLFQLLARNAIIVCSLVALFVSIKKLNVKYLLIIVGSLAILFSIVINHPHQYLREKVLYKLNPFDKDYKDKRVSRLEASINVIKTSPILGVGPGFDNKLRKEQYNKLEDSTAYKNSYNSHNQFFEYLVSNGFIGCLLFIVALGLLINLTIKSKNDSDLILIICFILACLSESILERSLGVKYFSILMLSITLNYIYSKNIN